MRYRKLFFLLVLISGLLVGGRVAYGQEESTIPEFNPMCWRAKDCCIARATVTRANESIAQCNAIAPDSDEESNGWVKADPCTAAGWGKCLPAGKTVTEISFGGRREFLHIGDFIKSMYNYAMAVVSIIATVMIILSGAQWVASGGNAETIATAKQRILGAVIGLFIAFFSYTILRTINPALVNLRLPQVWMTRSQGIVPQFCSAAPPASVFALAADAKDQKRAVRPGASPTYDLTYSGATTEKFTCGSRFFVKDGGDTTCFGDFCAGEGMTCTNVNINDSKADTYFCDKATLSGIVTYDTFLGDVGCGVGTLAPDQLGEGWEKPEIVDTGLTDHVGEQELWAVCQNGKKYEASAVSQMVTFSDTQRQIYRVTASPSAVQAVTNNCPANQLKGFVLKLEMNETCDPKDENHWIGWDGSRIGVDLGDDGFFDSKVKDMKDQYFIPLEKVKKGLMLNIDASQIYDIDETDLGDVTKGDRNRYLYLLK